MPHVKNLEAWDVSESDFPVNGTLTEKLTFCLRYAILAPSNYNSQPWFFEIHGDTLSLYADRRQALPVCDPDDRALMIAGASALYNLRTAIRYFGLSENTQYMPNPADEDLLANVQISEGPVTLSENDKALFHAIPKRHYNKGAFENREVPWDVLERLKDAAKAEGCWLHICEGDERDVIGHYIAEGDQIQMSNKGFRRELASWIHARRYTSGDGLPNYARGHKEVMTSARPRIVRRYETAPGEVVQDDEIAKTCPVLAILGSDKGGPVNRLYAGQAYMKVLLQAEADGLAVSPLNQPCEVPDLRLRLYDEIDHQQGRAHMVLRIGYGERPVSYAPRRPLEQVLSVHGATEQQAKPTPANDDDTQKQGFWSKVQKLFG